MNNLYNDTLDLYKRIDDVITAHFRTHKKQAPCAKGCASCCSQFFEISELEFCLIYEFIGHLPAEKQLMFKSNAKTLFSLFEEHWPIFYKTYFTTETIRINSIDYYKHPDRNNIVLPCIFLSSEGACEIYERRPIVCRTTGVGYQYVFNVGAICNVIHLGIFTPLWQANLRNFKTQINRVRWLKDDSSEIGIKRQFPMFYYAYDLLVNEQRAKYETITARYQMNPTI